MDWDLSSYFKEFNGPDYQAFKADLLRDLKQATDNLTQLDNLSDSNSEAWTRIIEALEDLSSRFGHLSSYLECLCAADATDDGYSAEYAWLKEHAAGMNTLNAQFNSLLGQTSDEAFAKLTSIPELEDAAFYLAECRSKAQYQMEDAAEDLASELNVNGINAWSQLYDTLSGQLKFQYVDEHGETQTAPMGQRVSLISGANRDVRISAFHGSNAAWEEHEATCNAALNALAGTRHSLDKRRGSDHFLNEACREARLEHATLDAMFQAIDDTIDLPRNILGYRSQQMGFEKAGYYDLYAPMDLPDQEPISWESGTQLVQGAFDSAYPALGAFNKELLEKRWVDYQPRDNKRPGGFCTGSQLNHESRIYMTFKDTMTAVTTYAHEVGHAWHSRVMSSQRRFASDYPMTLAESASTFAELLLSDGVLSKSAFSDAQKLALLDSDATRIMAFLLDIPVRYRWEERIYEERRVGIVSVKRMKKIMVEEQQKQFGDKLNEDGLDPYFWCSKLHFYIDDIRFYNFPYTFGYLLSVSLFARFKEEGSSFLPSYETFLQKSGSMSCEQVVQETLGENIQDPAFWKRAIESLNEPFTKLKALLD
ncbi:MAG: M3 family oligoendopeptidase [Opitutales bacterium]|nr:M3 family oligoendopeptidase [Opitutales bacterium]